MAAKQGYNLEFRRMVLELIEGGHLVSTVARELEINPDTVRRWRRERSAEYKRRPGTITPDSSRSGRFSAKPQLRKATSTQGAVSRSPSQLRGDLVLECSRLDTAFPQEMYLAVVIDGYSRTILASGVGSLKTSSLYKKVLEEAMRKLDPETRVNLIFDKGLEYSSKSFLRILSDLNIVISRTSLLRKSGAEILLRREAMKYNSNLVDRPQPEIDKQKRKFLEEVEPKDSDTLH